MTEKKTRNRKPVSAGDTSIVKVGKENLIDESNRRDLVVGSLGVDGSSGHVVILASSKWAGTQRVYDVNQYLIIKDVLIKNPGNFSNPTDAYLVVDLLRPNLYSSTITAKGKNITPADAKKWLDIEVSKRGKPVEDVIRDLYMERGNRTTLSFKSVDIAKINWARLENSSKIAIKRDTGFVENKLKAMSNLPGGTDHCSEFVRGAVPVPVFKGKNANEINDTIKETGKEESWVPPNPPPVMVAKRDETPPEQNAKPGGVAHIAVAVLSDMGSRKITGARFDEAKGRILLQASTDQLVVDVPVSKDEIAVALKCVFEREINPVLSMTYSHERPSNFEVQFTGPIFDTSFGQNMFAADSLLGSIMFGYLGPERDVTICEFSQWLQRWQGTRMLQIKGLGARVFMCTEKVIFKVDGSNLKCVDVKLRFVHETSSRGYAWVAERESLTQAAYLERGQARLKEMFPVLNDFCRLGSILAILKFLRLQGIQFDWQWVKQYVPAKNAFPIFLPLTEWSPLSGGLNLDGWASTGDRAIDAWKIDGEDFVGSMPNQNPAGPVVLYSTRVWASFYEMEFLLKTQKSPLKFLCKYLPGKPFASIELDSPEDFSLFRVTVKDVGDVADDNKRNDLIVLKDGEPYWQGQLSQLYANTGLDLTKPASFGFALEPDREVRISNIRFR